MEVFTPDYVVRLLICSVTAGLALRGASKLSERLFCVAYTPLELKWVAAVALFFLAGFQMVRDYRHAAVVVVVAVGGSLAKKWHDHRERRVSSDSPSTGKADG